MVKRIISILLVSVMLFTAVPVIVWAESADGVENIMTVKKAEGADQPVVTDAMYDPVYYSDLFYGYDPSYFRSEYITTYARDTYDVPFRIFKDFCESQKFIAVGMKLGAEAFGNPKTLIDSYNTFFGDYDVTYYEALDAANLKMFEAMFDSNGSMYTGWGKKLMKSITLFNTYVKEFRDNRYSDGSLEGLSDAEKFEQILEDFFAKGIASEIERGAFN
ncbi:MAG: hypothetical protein IKU19_05725, partial [Clostridia bacterium]|nr:hypothetical protein [Clostridia bacterium]